METIDFNQVIKENISVAGELTAKQFTDNNKWKFPTKPAGSMDCNDMTETAMYIGSTSANANKPTNYENYGGFFLVYRNTSGIIQWFVTDMGVAFYRLGRVDNYYKDWIKMT